MNEEKDLDQLLKQWKEQKSLSEQKAEVIKERILSESMEEKREYIKKGANGNQNTPYDYRWWLELLLNSTVDSINRANAIFDYEINLF